MSYPDPCRTSARSRRRPESSGSKSSPYEIQRREDITPAFDALKDRADALYIANRPFMAANRRRVITLALGLRPPTMGGSRGWPDVGGLMSFGVNFPDLGRRSAEMVDKILRGAKPADIPVEQPTKFELVINLKTAMAIGITIPESFLARADEVIE